MLGSLGIMGQLGFAGARLSSAVANTPWWLSGGINVANAIAVYQPIGAASLAESYVNLANPGTHDATAGVAPTFNTATGWTFDNSKYLVVPSLTPAAGYTMIARFDGISLAQTSWIAGSTNATVTRRWGFGQGQSNFAMWRYGSSVLTSGGEVASGVQALAGLNAYMDGVFVNTLADASMPDGALHISGQRSGDTTTRVIGNILALAVYNTILTADQVAVVSAALAALT